jgi:predicted permease
MKRLHWLIRNLTRRDRVEAGFSEELRSCLEILIQERIAQGLDPAEARRRALLELGGMEQIRLQVREARMGASLEVFLQDVRFGVRTLRKSKGWTAVIVLSLALGIGFNTLMFSLVNGLFLRSINVSEPDRLVRLRWSGAADFTALADVDTPNAITGHDPHSAFPRMVWTRLRQNPVMPDLMAVVLQQAIVSVDGDSQWADGLVVSGNYYSVLGARPFLGRLITADDDREGAPMVAVISHAYWRNRFAEDSSVVGKKIIANDTAATIVGVTPRDFLGIQSLSDDGQDVTFALAMQRVLNRVPPQNRFWDYLWPEGFAVQLMGRVAPGVTAAQAQAAMQGIFQDAVRETWDLRLQTMTPAQLAQPLFQNKTQLPNLLLESGRRGLNDTDAKTVRAGQILTIVVLLLLLIVCANVANLVLSAATTRKREISVRLSLGATRFRLIRQLLTESLLLATVGGLLGLAINQWGRELIPTFRSVTVSYDMPNVNVGLMPALDWRIAAFVIGLTLGCAVLFGLIPALQATRLNLVSELKQDSRRFSGSRSILSRGLLVAQVAISIVLLVGAGLLLRSLGNLRDVDLGFNPDNVVTFHMSVRAVPGAARQRDMFQKIEERSRSLPGVRSVAGSGIAFWQTKVSGSARVALRGAADSTVVDAIGVTPGFFATMQMPILSGRDFTEQDLGPPSRVIVINEAARVLFGGAEPIGSTLSLVGQDQIWEVIGMVGNARFGDVREPLRPLIYIPARQFSFVLRTDADLRTLAPAIRAMVREIEPMAPVTDIVTQRELVEGRLQPERLLTTFYVFFGSIALLLASIGLFALMSYSVARRTNEIGVRMALGARRNDVVKLVMRESLMLVGVGVLAGLVGALALGRWISSQLYGIGSIDAFALTAAIVTMVGVSLFATYLPAGFARSSSGSTARAPSRLMPLLGTSCDSRRSSGEVSRCNRSRCYFLISTRPTRFELVW